MSQVFPMTRRRLLKTLFCSSVAMRLNLSTTAWAQDFASSDVLNLMAIGDFGSGNHDQKIVANAMAAYTQGLAKPPAGVILLGDNFYGTMKGGLKSSRWQSGFSNPYPAKTYPGPCWAILGNHDYHDNPGGEQVQLGYAASLDRKTRWTIPGKYYRVDLPAKNPQVTLLMIDTNWESINRRVHAENYPCWMNAKERAAQQAWLEKELALPRAPFTIVVGHHPLYSDGEHKDTPELVNEIGPLLEKAGVHLYLCGHDHDLQHLELEGLKTSFVVSGGGGHALHPPGDLRQGSVFLKVHGFSHLAIAQNRLHVRHIDDSGKIVHSFSKGVNHDWKIEA